MFQTVRPSDTLVMGEICIVGLCLVSGFLCRVGTCAGLLLLYAGNEYLRLCQRVAESKKQGVPEGQK
jgi:hypothetical protein